MSKLWATSEEASDWWRSQVLFISAVPKTPFDTTVTRSWMSLVECNSHIPSWVLLTHSVPQTEKCLKKKWLPRLNLSFWFHPDDETAMRSSDLANFLKCSKSKKNDQCNPVMLSCASYSTDGMTMPACRCTRAESGFNVHTHWFGKEAAENKKNRILVGCNTSVFCVRESCCLILSHIHFCRLSRLEKV